jgi:Mlc titration factor MtfA (ptsG expression regulator)
MVLGFLKERRRRRLRKGPIPDEWWRILKRNMPIFARLSPVDQTELLGHVQVFLAEKHFEGCGGLEVTEEIRVTIATQACLLLLHRKTDYFPCLITILVYPSSYQVEEERYVEGPIWERGSWTRLGQTGRELRSMVIAWDAAKQGAADPSDGRNVVLHEFAHQLDFEDYVADGAPVLASRAEYRNWARVMREEFEALRAANETGIPTLLDTYGATNPAEFFAVVTEAFFERPWSLRAMHPRLYAEFSRFFRQDPVSYSAEHFKGSVTYGS